MPHATSAQHYLFFSASTSLNCTFFSQIRHHPTVFYCMVNISFTRTIHHVYIFLMRHATCDIGPTLPFFSQIRYRPTVPFFLRFDITQLYFYCLINISFTRSIPFLNATCDMRHRPKTTFFISDSTSPAFTFIEPRGSDTRGISIWDFGKGTKIFWCVNC